MAIIGHRRNRLHPHAYEGEMDKKLLNRTDAADYLGVDRHTLINWEKENYGPQPGRTPNGQPLYSRSQLDEFVDNFGTEAA